MRIAVYGLPSSGKTTLIEKIPNVTAIAGRETLDRLSDGKFSDMEEDEKRRIRVLYTRYLLELEDEIIVSDGHYSFLDNVVFTPDDGDIYDVFFYLYCKPDELLQRFSQSEKNKKYSNLSEETLKQWQEFEIESLRKECHRRNKDFYVISDYNQTTLFYRFFDLIVNGYSVVADARIIVEKINSMYPDIYSRELCIVDGDKTVIEQDSFRFCYEGKTTVFDGDFYTGYQSYLFSKEIEAINSIPDCINKIKLNDDVWDMINDKQYVVLSSGITIVWKKLKEIFGLAEVIASPMISADSKYYIVKFLKEKGYRIIACGDSKNDYYMLKEADMGYLKIGSKISRSLSNTDITGITLLYDKTPFFLVNEATQEILDDIQICKSNSGINGGRLATAHLSLGQRLGNKLSTVYPSKNTAVLVLDRGGRFFGDGLYSSFGGVFYPYNPSVEEMPLITQERVVIVDSVINSGRSVNKIITKLLENNPTREIVIASNVVQQAAIELLSDYKLFAVRSSSNSYIGKRQAIQRGKSGPDTADRLFNIIDRSF